MVESLFDPILGRRLEVRDIREIVDKITPHFPPDEKSVQLVRALQRNQYVGPLAKTAVDLSQCFPAGLGAAVGTYFEPVIMGFDDLTAIHWIIVAPKTLDSTNLEPVILTSSNQASQGAEALVTYAQGNEALFTVWDWAHPEVSGVGRTVVSIPYSLWGDYLFEITLGPDKHPAIHVVNRTTLISKPKWRNEVLILNVKTETLDRVWKYDHDWDTEDGCKFLFFGPCIEVKSSSPYGATKTIGYAKGTLVTNLRTTKFDATNSRFVAKKNPGLEVRFQRDHHTVVAD